VEAPHCPIELKSTQIKSTLSSRLKHDTLVIHTDTPGLHYTPSNTAESPELLAPWAGALSCEQSVEVSEHGQLVEEGPAVLA